MDPYGQTTTLVESSLVYRSLAGKATFLKFMLVQLISADQVVVLFDNSRIYLFYHGIPVYFRPTTTGLRYLPSYHQED